MKFASQQEATTAIEALHGSQTMPVSSANFNYSALPHWRPLSSSSQKAMAMAPFTGVINAIAAKEEVTWPSEPTSGRSSGSCKRDVPCLNLPPSSYPLTWGSRCTANWP